MISTATGTIDSATTRAANASTIARPARPVDAARLPRSGSSPLWVVFGFSAGQLVRLASNILLSRLLFPEAFGLMSLVTSLLIGLEMFCDLGIGASVIQNKHGDEPKFIDTAWTLQTGRGFVIFLATVVAGWPMSWFYNQPALMWLVPLAGSTAICSGLSSTSLFTARRHGQLRRLYLFEFAVQTIGVSVGCLWAWMHPSVFALVLGSLTSSVIRCLGSHLVLGGHRHRWCWDEETIKQVAHFGKWVYLSSMIAFLAMQSDRLVLGKLVDETTLGIYSVASSLSMLPQMFITSLAVSWVFPTMSRHFREQHRAINEVLRPIRKGLLSVGMVLVLGIYVESDLLFRVVYDSRYQMAVPIIHFTCVTTWLSLLAITLEPAVVAAGDSKSSALASAARFSINLVSSLIGFHLYGLWGFIIGYWIGGAVAQAIVVVRTRRLGIHLLEQDVFYTLLLAGLLYSIHVLQGLGGLTALIAPQVIIASSLVWLAWNFYRLMQQARSSSQPATAPVVA